MLDFLADSYNWQFQDLDRQYFNFVINLQKNMTRINAVFIRDTNK